MWKTSLSRRTGISSQILYYSGLTSQTSIHNSDRTDTNYLGPWAKSQARFGMWRRVADRLMRCLTRQKANDQLPTSHHRLPHANPRIFRGFMLLCELLSGKVPRHFLFRQSCRRLPPPPHPVSGRTMLHTAVAARWRQLNQPCSNVACANGNTNGWTIFPATFAPVGAVVSAEYTRLTKPRHTNQAAQVPYLWQKLHQDRPAQETCCRP